MPAMHRVTTVSELRSELDRARAAGSSVGLVPTMGYLHEGHLSLATAAAAECDVVVMTIFVNPLQFAPGEDLDVLPAGPRGRCCQGRGRGGHDPVLAVGVARCTPRDATR